MMATASTVIDLDTLVTICQRLESLVASSLGPGCLKTLLCTATGSLRVTNSGIDILNALHMSHPIARLIVDSIKTCHNFTGDGSKTYVLYLTSLLRGVRKCVGRKAGTSQEREKMIQISLGINKFLQDLPTLHLLICRTNLQPMRDQSATCMQPMGYQSATCMQPMGDQSAACMQPMGDQSATCMQPMGYQSATCMQPMGYQSATCMQTMEDQISTCMQPLGGQRSTCMQPLGGHRSTCMRLCAGQLSSCYTRRMVDHFSNLMTNYVGCNVGCSLAMYYVIDNFDLMHVKCNNDSYSSSTCLPGIVLDRNFQLKCSPRDDEATAIFLRCPVEYIPQELGSDVTIAIRTGSNIQNNLHEMTNKSCQFLKKCCKLGVKLIITTEKIPNFVVSQCQSLEISIICYVLEEDMAHLEYAFKVQSVSSTNDEVTTNNVCIINSKQLYFGGRTFVHLFVNEKYVVHNGHDVKTLLLCAPTEGLCKQLSINLHRTLKVLHLAFHDNEKEHVEQLITGSNAAEAGPQQQGVDFDEDSNISQTDLINDHTNHDDLINAGINRLIPVGAGFEFALTKHLTHLKKTYTDQNLIMFCDILHETMLNFTQILHKNLSTVTTNKKHYLITKECILQRLNCGIPSWFDRRGEWCSTAGECPLEPLAMKWHVLESVMWILHQLLIVDSIVSGRSTDD